MQKYINHIEIKLQSLCTRAMFEYNPRTIENSGTPEQQ